MEPRYDIKEVESRIYAAWEKSGFFNPDVCIEKGVTPANAKPFTVILPPPNVTGELHMGHAAMLAIEDIIVRFNRMRRRRTLWVPGTDHAAIATQSRVEKDLAKTEKKSRHDLGREEFLRRVNEFAQKSHDTIVRQIKRMGASLDWSREAYTLDAARSRAVRTAFKKLYDMGMIYRGNRIVNWDPKGQTVISDDEVVHEERTAKLYTFRYDGHFPIAISTTRLETKFGDTGVAVHPDDARYAAFVGKKYEAVFCGTPIHVKVVADEAVDKDFGTGAVGVTPAHSAIDWEIAERHKLPLVQVINERGRMTVAGPVHGKKSEEAREWVAEELRRQGLIEKEEEIAQNVSTAERTGAVIEPLPKLQWFVAVEKPCWRGWRKITLKRLMRDAVMNGDVCIVPERFEKTYFHWIENLRDWCISRQIWFGHRVPVWYRTRAGWNLKLYREETLANIERGGQRFETRAGKTAGAEKDWRRMKPGEKISFTAVDPENEKPLSLPPVTKTIVATRHFSSIDEMLKKIPLSEIAPGSSEKEYKEQMAGYPGFPERLKQYGVWAIELKPAKQEMHVGEAPEGDGWEQDPDTLDTWFSSGLWPFSVLGWPEKTGDLETYFPNSVLETGYDILFFWVARMILTSGALMGDVPFRAVYLHGLVRDAKGRKMSKSLGNGIDPLEMADAYGADATRLSLIIGASAGSDLKLSEDRIRGYRNFSTKIWNIARFINMNRPTKMDEEAYGHITHRREIEELDALKREVTAHLDAFEFHLAGEKLYHYVWHTLADKIVEAEKQYLRDGSDEQKCVSYALLERLLLDSLKMLHPFMPFVTEEIYGIFRPGKMLMVETW